MSSRQEEKERRRQERLAKEREEAAKTARAQRLRLASGGVLAVAAVAAIAVALFAGSGGGSSDKNPIKNPSGSSAFVKAQIPAPRITDLAQAAKAAGCVIRHPVDEGNTHVLTRVHYRSNPPASGNHYPVPAHDGAYAPGQTPRIETLVHALEHGRIEIQWSPGQLTRKQIGQLKALFDERPDLMLLFQNTTHMPYAVAAVAWDNVLGCKTFNQRVFDAIRAFRDQYVGKGPEFIPGPE